VDSEAYLGGNLVTVDGTATGQPALRVGKNRVEISLGKKQPSLLWLGQYLREGILKGRPFPPQVRWVWGWALLFLLLHLMAVWVFPRGVQATADTLASRPVASLGMGLLTVVLAGPVLGLLTLTVVGLVAVPFLGCALVVALWFGKAGLYTCTGQRAGRLLGANLLPQPVLALVIGTGLLYFTYMLPWLGFPMLGTMTLLAVGSATLAALTPARREALTPPPATATPSPAPISFAGPVPPVVPAMPIPLVSAPGEQPPAMPMADGRVNNLDIGWTGADVDYATLPRVGFWRRLAASALDLLLLAVLLAAFGKLKLTVWLLYHFILWGWQGTTVGGMVMGLKIVRENGRPINYSVAFIRALSAIFSLLALGIGFFWAGWTQPRRAWHDLIAGTIVVRAPRHKII
jgi:hypothetical protein